MKVYLIEKIDEEALKKIEKEFEITNVLSEADIVISRNLKMDKAFIDEAKNLKCIGIHGTGISECDVTYAKERGIVVFNCPYQNYESVAELNLMLALMASRTKGPIGKDLKGKVAAILGYGHIGIRTEELLKAFQMEVLVYQRGGNLSIEEVLKPADYVFITMSLKEDSYHFLDEKKLKLLKKNCILINTARGAIVDEKALRKALHEKRLFCYASDVFENEPLAKDEPLLKENVIAYPHIGSQTEDSLRNLGNLIYEQIMEFKQKKKPRFLI